MCLRFSFHLIFEMSVTSEINLLLKEQAAENIHSTNQSS